MVESNQNFKRLPTFRLYICDLHNGDYNEEDRALYTIYGPIKRIRILGTVLKKKIVTDPSSYEDDNMIKDADPSKSRISYLINDGTGSIWITLWNVNDKNYEQIAAGDTVSLIGIVRENDGKVVVYPEIIRKISNSNEIILHELEIIMYLKNNGIYSENYNNKNKLPEKFIDETFESSSEENFEFLNSGIDELSESDEFDEWETDVSQADDYEIEEKIFNLIKTNDKGNGVSLDSIVKNMKIKKIVVDDIIKKLCLNTRIYNTYDDTYKIVEEE